MIESAGTAEESDLDLEKIVKQLMQENEGLRLRIIKMREMSRFDFVWQDVKEFIGEHYLLIIIGLYILSIVIDLIIGMMRSNREK